MSVPTTPNRHLKYTKSSKLIITLGVYLALLGTYFTFYSVRLYMLKIVFVLARVIEFPTANVDLQHKFLAKNEKNFVTSLSGN